MTENDNGILIGSEKNNARVPDTGRWVDIHCHCLAGVDDGPVTMSESLALCRGLVNDGLTAVIATPHQLGRYSDCNEASQIREAVLALNEELKNNGIPLVVAAGGDVRVDERIGRLLAEDKILTLGDSRKYILLELPSEIFIDIEPLIIELASVDIQVIISHPERHPVLCRRPSNLFKWLEYSAHFQVTAGSVLGRFGPMAQRAACDFLGSGLACLVATDSHNLDSRSPCMKAAFAHICGQLGETVARQVCIKNPLRVLNGQEILVTSGIRI